MADVFVSYARSEEPQAARVGHALRELGYAVWRDDELPAHRAYAEVIEERLKSADAVVVLWSAEAAKSEWVRAEADTARHLGTLIQATLDGTIPPLPFNQIQCADLSHWTGAEDDRGWRKLVASVQSLAGAAAAEGGKRRSATSVCVLPFANMSGDVEQEYFSDGISEDITTDLSKISALQVVARNTAFQFKGQSVDVGEVARKLGVSHVLEGSVRKAGGRVRITAQLIDGESGDHVWAERYDRELTDIFAIQDELSKAIVDALKVRLLPEEKKAIENRGTSSVEAYNLYLMAHNYWVTGNWGDPREAQLVERVCKRAIEVDPDYARAWGLLAITQCVLHFVHQQEGEDGLAAAERALALDPNLAEAVVAKARYFQDQGLFDEAIEVVKRAVELGPDSWEVHHEAAFIYYFQRRYEEAAHHFEKAASIAENDFHSWGMLTSIYEELGENEKLLHAARMAVTNAERALAQNPTNGQALAMGATGLAVLGEAERFREWVERAQLVDPDNMIMQYNFACAFAMRFKDYDRALLFLEKRAKTITAPLLRAWLNDPDLKGMKDLPRFKALVAETKKRLGVEMPSSRY